MMHSCIHCCRKPETEIKSDLKRDEMKYEAKREDGEADWQRRFSGERLPKLWDLGVI